MHKFRSKTQLHFHWLWWLMRLPGKKKLLWTTLVSYPIVLGTGYVSIHIAFHYNCGVRKRKYKILFDSKRSTTCGVTLTTVKTNAHISSSVYLQSPSNHYCFFPLRCLWLHLYKHIAYLLFDYVNLKFLILNMLKIKLSD